MIFEKTFLNKLKRKINLIASKKTPEKFSKKINVGIIGAGNVAFWKYVPAIATLDCIKFIGAYDSNSQASKKLCSTLAGVDFPSDEKLIADPKIDAVFICTPPETQFPLLKSALLSGKHILCEKPMTNNFEDSKEIVKIIKETDLIGMVNYSFRFKPEWILIKDILRSGLIGNVHNVVGQFAQGGWFDASYAPCRERNDFADWRYHPGGGIANELGSHMIDMCLWLFGKINEITVKTATFGSQERPSEDICGFLMSFANGGITQVQVSRLATGYKEFCHMEIFGQKGTIRNEHGRIFLWLRDDPHWKELLLPSIPSNQFLLTFVKAINHQTTDYPSFEDGLEVRRIIDSVSSLSASCKFA